MIRFCDKQCQVRKGAVDEIARPQEPISEVSQHNKIWEKVQLWIEWGTVAVFLLGCGPGLADFGMFSDKKLWL